MSYATVAICARDIALRDRLTSALVQEGHDMADATPDYQWRFASLSDVEAAYASALASENPNPGGDEGVITDGMILASVQAHPPAAP